MAQISHKLPFISSIIVQADNVESYNNAFLLCAIPLLNAFFYPKGIAIVEFIHTETQYGKTILDARFARMMKFVKRNLTEGAKVNHISWINTPISLCMEIKPWWRCSKCSYSACTNKLCSTSADRKEI